MHASLKTIGLEDLVRLYESGYLPQAWIEAYMASYTINPIGDAQEALRINDERKIIQSLIVWATPALMMLWLLALAFVPKGQLLAKDFGVWSVIVPYLCFIGIALYLICFKYPLIRPQHAERFIQALEQACAFVKLSIRRFLESPESLSLAMLPALEQRGIVDDPEPGIIEWLQMLGFYRTAR